MCVPADRGLQAPGSSLWKVLVTGGSQPAPWGPFVKNKALPQPLCETLCFLNKQTAGLRIKVPWALHVCVLTRQTAVKERTFSFTLWAWLPAGTRLCRFGYHMGLSWREQDGALPGSRWFSWAQAPLHMGV